MENKDKNEEIQSRREFFKQAAKKALPILGAVVLTSTPILSAASEKRIGSTDCSQACVGSCGYACTTCWTGCTGTCESCRQGCNNNCTGRCEQTCMNDCENGCKGRCKNGCGWQTENPGSDYFSW